MRTASYHFRWFEKEDGRKPLRVSVGKDGKLRIGKTLRARLPQYIRIGFDESKMTLAIADGHGTGIQCPTCGIITARELSAQIEAIGLQLPAAFDLKRDEQTGYLVGQTILRYHTSETGRRQFDEKELLTWGKTIVTDAVRQMAKSMPLEDRRSAAIEALCTAAQNYHPGLGNLAVYLKRNVRLALRTENRRYQETFACRSLDQPLTHSGEEDDNSLYHVISDHGEWADSIDAQLDARQFCAQLSPQEQDMIHMLQEGFQLAEVGDIFGMSEQELRHVAAEIARRKRAFDREAHGPNTVKR